MHIAIVNQWYPPETGGGGVASHNYNFARACVQLGHKVTVIALRRSGKTAFRQSQDGISILRVQVPDLYRLRKLPVIGRQYKILQALIHSAIVCRTLGRVHRQESVTVAEFADVNAEAFFWNTQLSRILIVRCHAPMFHLARYYFPSELPYEVHWLGQAEKRTIKRANLITAPSQAMARIVGDDCGVPHTQIRVIPNAVERVNHPRKPHQLDTPVTILFLGRLERLKGIEVLASAIPRVFAKLDHVQFSIVGPSRPTPSGKPYSEYLKETLGQYIQRGYVQLIGFMSHEDIASLYDTTQISVVPSLYESFSFTVAQAMMRGIPVIASRVGGIPETLDHGRCGVLVEPNDPQALADAIIDLAQDATKREQLGQAAREHALTHYSSDVVAKRILQVYEDALD